MTVLDDLLAYTVAQTTLAVATAGSSGDLSIEQALDSMPSTLVTFYEQGGLRPRYEFSTSTGADVVYERPNVQVISRSTSPLTARSRLQTIYTLFDGLTALTGTSTKYIDISTIQPPFQLLPDGSDRHLWAVNFSVKKQI